MPIRYLRWLCEFTHNLAKSLPAKKPIFTSLEKYELGQLNSVTYSELCKTFKMGHFAFWFKLFTVFAKQPIFDA